MYWVLWLLEMSANKIFILMDTRVGGTDDQHADTANTRWEQQGLALSKTVSTQSAELWLSAMGQSMKTPQQRQGHSRDWDKGREACKCLGKVPTQREECLRRTRGQAIRANHWCREQHDSGRRGTERLFKVLEATGDFIPNVMRNYYKKLSWSSWPDSGF